MEIETKMTSLEALLCDFEEKKDKELAKLKFELEEEKRDYKLMNESMIMQQKTFTEMQSEIETLRTRLGESEKARETVEQKYQTMQEMLVETLRKAGQQYPVHS